MKKYAIIVEKAEDGGFGAYAPDIPGVGGVGDTREEAIQNLIEGVQFYFESLQEEGYPLPEATSEAENLILPDNEPQT